MGANIEILIHFSEVYKKPWNAENSPTPLMEYLERQMAEFYTMDKAIYAAHVKNPIETGTYEHDSPIEFGGSELTMFMQQLQLLITSIKNIDGASAEALKEVKSLVAGHDWKNCLPGNAGDVNRFAKKLIPPNFLQTAIHDVMEGLTKKYESKVAYEGNRRHVPISIFRRLDFAEGILNLVDHHDAFADNYSNIVNELKTQKNAILHQMFMQVVDIFNQITIQLIQLQHQHAQLASPADLKTQIEQLHIYKALNILAIEHEAYFDAYAQGKDIVQINDIKIQLPVKDKAQFDALTKKLLDYFGKDGNTIKRSFGQKLPNMQDITISQADIDAYVTQNQDQWKAWDFNDDDIKNKIQAFVHQSKIKKSQASSQTFFADFALPFSAVEQGKAAQTYDKLQGIAAALGAKPEDCQISLEPAYLNFNDALKQEDADNFNFLPLIADMQKKVVQQCQQFGVHFIAHVSLQEALGSIQNLLSQLDGDAHHADQASGSGAMHTNSEIEAMAENSSTDPKGKASISAPPSYQAREAVTTKKSSIVLNSPQEILAHLIHQHSPKSEELSIHAQMCIRMLQETQLTHQQQMDILPIIQHTSLSRAVLSKTLQLLFKHPPTNFNTEVVKNVLASVAQYHTRLGQDLHIGLEGLVNLVHKTLTDQSLTNPHAWLEAFLSASSQIPAAEQQAFFDTFAPQVHQYSPAQIKNMAYLWQKTDDKTMYDAVREVSRADNLQFMIKDILNDPSAFKISSHFSTHDAIAMLKLNDEAAYTLH